MTTGPLAQLLGQTIVMVEAAEELAFRLNDGCWITIINPSAYGRGGQPLGFEALLGQSVTGVDQGVVDVRFDFADGSRLTVDLSEEAWAGPEAVIFNLADGAVVVIN